MDGFQSGRAAQRSAELVLTGSEHGSRNIPAVSKTLLRFDKACSYNHGGPSVSGTGITCFANHTHTLCLYAVRQLSVGVLSNLTGAEDDARSGLGGMGCMKVRAVRSVRTHCPAIGYTRCRSAAMSLPEASIAHTLTVDVLRRWKCGAVELLDGGHG